jgi:exonuclease III
MDSVIHEIKADEKGRYIMLKGVFDGQELTLLNLYAPTADKSVEQAEFCDEIAPLLEENSVNLILGGDLNTYLEEADKYGNNVTITKFATRLKHIMNELGLIYS